MNLRALTKRAEAVEKECAVGLAPEQALAFVLSEESLTLAIAEHIERYDLGDGAGDRARCILRAADEARASWNRIREEYCRRHHAMLQKRGK